MSKHAREIETESSATELVKDEAVKQFEDPPIELDESLHETYRTIISTLKSMTLSAFDVEFAHSVLAEVVCVPAWDREDYLNEILDTFLVLKCERQGNSYQQDYSLIS